MPDTKDMFASISGRYDLLNHILSLCLDFYWRKCLFKLASPYLTKEDSALLDIASGTGDVAFTFTEIEDVKIFSSDFCFDMIYIAKYKSGKYKKPVFFTCTNGEELNFKDKSFNVVTNAFALRNIENLHKAFSEMKRVLKPGGLCLSLEFARPKNIFIKPFFLLYLNLLLPLIGKFFSGNYKAYKYLSSSIQEFMTPDELCRLISKSGFKNVRYKTLIPGVVNIYLAE
jgi:demethylmenaquinone methyltransferase/2-methoxy-6-polyprenyl-1,4-benzoquinol methylase